jgi:hypothetical protein
VKYSISLYYLFCNKNHLLLWQNYFEKLEKLSAAEEIQGDGPKKERTKLITPQVAKLEHAYQPGKVLAHLRDYCFNKLEVIICGEHDYLDR